MIKTYWEKYVTNCVTPTFTESLLLAADKEIAELKENSIPCKKVQHLIDNCFLAGAGKWVVSVDDLKKLLEK